MKLTREQIEAMGAGPEMNAAIHEGVMGLQLQNRSILKHGGTWVGCRYVDPPPAYSTDIAAAMEAVDKVESQRVVSLRRIDGDWLVAIAVSACKVVDTKADKAPLAICRAALLWKLEREQSK